MGSICTAENVCSKAASLHCSLSLRRLFFIWWSKTPIFELFFRQKWRVFSEKCLQFFPAGCIIMAMFRSLEATAMGRIDKESYYLDIAETVLERSTCSRSHSGALIVRNDEIVSTGYNGAPRGRSNCIDLGYCIRERLGIPAGGGRPSPARSECRRSRECGG